MSDNEKFEPNDDFTNLSEEKKAELDRIASELANGDVLPRESNGTPSETLQHEEIVSHDTDSVLDVLESASQRDDMEVRSTGSKEIDGILESLQSRDPEGVVDFESTAQDLSESSDVLDNQREKGESEWLDVSSTSNTENATPEYGEESEPSMPSWLSEDVPMDEYSNYETSETGFSGTSSDKDDFIAQVGSDFSRSDSGISFETNLREDIDKDDNIVIDEHADFEGESGVIDDHPADAYSSGKLDNDDDIVIDEHADFEIEDSVIDERFAETDFSADHGEERKNGPDDEGDHEGSNLNAATSLAALLAANSAARDNPPVSNQVQAAPYVQNSSAMNGFASMYGSLGSLFAKSNAIEQRDLSFKEHMENAASRDIARLAKLQAEHSSLMSQAVELTNPKNYNPDNENRVLSLLSDISKSSGIIESQSQRLSISTSNMKEQSMELRSNNGDFEDITTKMGDALKEHIEEIDNDKFKEVFEKIAQSLKKIFQSIFSKNNESSGPELST